MPFSCSGARTRVRAGVLVGALAVMVGPARSETATALWDQVRSASLDPARAVRVEGLEITMEHAVLYLDHGILVPARPIGGRTSEMVFIGQGRFRMSPPDKLERAQLELFTDRAELDVAVDQAVVAMGSESIAARLLGRESIGTLDPAMADQAAKAFRAWVEGAERRGFGADAAQLQALMGDALYQQFVVAWCRSSEVGEFFYRLDPAETEQVTLGQFVALDADVLEEHRIRKVIRKGQREGRFRQLRFEDLGDWDTWISTALPGKGGKPSPGSAGFESESYVLDVAVDPNQESLAGRARIAIRSEASGRRVVPLSLSSDLVVRSVEDDVGRPLVWVRSGRDLYVVLPTPSQANGHTSLSVSWDGKAFEEIQKGIYSLSDTFTWYPRVGDADRATYDATLRWPKGRDLLASGRVVEAGEEAGRRWERRKLDLPAAAFSFEVGEFDVRQAEAGHVDLTIGFSEAAGSIDKGAKDEVVQIVQEALVFLEERFGPYPLDTMTVVTVPRGYSQGFLGFVSLSHYLLWVPSGYGTWYVVDPDEENDPGARTREERRETIAHELAHQWWGNKVGWFSYRDQWLSEALADFSATLFAAYRAERKSVYLARHARRWKSAIAQGSNYGRTVESLGPVVMGSRLNSSQSSAAYPAVVYDKGSVVFHMLARALGPEPFAEMLKTLADRVNNRVIDTATFLAAIEKMSGLDLDDFADQFIYGTGVPEVYYTYRFVPQDGGRWLIEGEARQVSRGGYDYTLQKTAAGSWDVARRYRQAVDVEHWALVVPFQASLAETKQQTTTVGGMSRQKTTTEAGLGGALVLQGEVSPIRITIDRKPANFWLDQRGEVLASFYCEQRTPKRMLRYRAERVARAGQHDEAEALYHQSLAAPVLAEGSTDHPPSKKEQEELARNEDAATHIGLAALHLDRGRDSAAVAALDTADGMLKGLDKNEWGFARKKLRARIAVRAGSYAKAYDELSKMLHLDFPFRESETLADAARRQRFRSSGRLHGDGEDYALLAASAWETGHEDVAVAALKEAEKRAADMNELKSLMPAAKTTP